MLLDDTLETKGIPQPHLGIMYQMSEQLAEELFSYLMSTKTHTLEHQCSFLARLGGGGGGGGLLIVATMQDLCTVKLRSFTKIVLNLESISKHAYYNWNVISSRHRFSQNILRRSYEQPRHNLHLCTFSIYSGGSGVCGLAHMRDGA